MKNQLIFILLFLPVVLLAQDEEDLLSLLEEEPTTDFTSATFKASRIINLHSIETTSEGVLDFKISHRFGRVNGGFYDLFGLDMASIRIGGEYGINDWLTIGMGRSSYEKTYDGFIKMKLLRQSTGKRTMPISAIFFASTAMQTLQWQNPDRTNYFSSRLYYTFQLGIARKISDKLSLQFSPTLVHRNLVKTLAESNDVMAFGFGGRYKLSKRVSFNTEYILVPPNQLANGFKNAFSVGIDIETGGHVFQLHFTNSTAMIERGFVAETTGDWGNAGVHFGFNVSRVFTLKEKE